MIGGIHAFLLIYIRQEASGKKQTAGVELVVVFVFGIKAADMYVSQGMDEAFVAQVDADVRDAFFAVAVVPLRDKLLNYARRMTDDPSDAEDAVQEVMLKLWNLRQKLDEYRSIEAVAMTMTHHLCMDMWRAKRPDTLSLDRVQAPTPSATPERLLEEKDEFRLMREIIDSLPTLQRTIIRMKDIEEYETEEIAEITGCNAEAIRSNLSRARKKVREVYLQTIQERKRRNKA